MSDRGRDVAIIGMSCIFPQAPDLRAFWENILAGVDAIGDPLPGSDIDRIYDPASGANDRLYTKRGGYLRDIARFDPLAFGVMPRSVDGSEPEHFMALRLAHDALADAGYLDRPFNRRTAGLILGRGTYVNRGVISCFQHAIVVDQVLSILKRLHPEHSEQYLEELKRDLKESLPPFNPETAPGLAHSVMCGRIANRLDLMGPAFTIDAACASSLIAVDLGIRHLQSGACDLVLAGGIQISTTYPIALMFSQLGALARSGRLRPFHPEADGTLLGEGAGIVVLKRREDAERDGDRIYALIKGVGTSSDGKAMGILAPRLEGEELAMRRAYDGSGIDPQSIGLIEAHGTGTPVGDATEIEALRSVFGDGDGAPRVPVGSVKSMIGHCIPAAAAAGLIKTALALYHRVLPPTLHADAPHPRLDESRFYLNSATRPWIHAGPDPRRAGVSAFGFGGINAHAVLEEASAEAGVLHRAARAAAAPAAPDPARITLLHARRDTELFVIRAATRADLAARCGALRRFLRENPDVPAWDLAFTLNCGAAGAGTRDGARTEGGEARLAIVAVSLSELDRKLAYAAERLGDATCRRIKEISGIYYFDEPLGPGAGLAFLFPGEGAQYAGMLGDLCLHFPEARRWFDLMDRAFRDHDRGFLPSQVLFPPPTRGSAGADRRLWDMESAIESVFAANQAMLAILTGLGVHPRAIVGHSTGEYSALLAAGAVEVGSEERLIQYILDGNRATERAKRSDVIPPGALLAVGPADPALLRSLCERAGDSIHLAMDNCPHQTVVCGPEEAITRLHGELRGQGAVCQRLPFSRAYHTPMFAPVCEELREYYERATFVTPRTALYSCTIAARAPDDPAELRRLALLQWARPVRFRETIEAMHADGLRIFVEVGPRGNLTAFVEDTLRGRPHLAVPSNVQRRSGLSQLHHLLGLLAAHGVPLDLRALYENRGARFLPVESIAGGARLPVKPDRSIRLSLELPSLRLDERRFPAAPFPPGSSRATAGPPAVARAAQAVRRPDVGAAAMREYLRTMDRFLETQEAVMRAGLRPARGRGGNGAGRNRGPLLGAPVRGEAGGATVFHRVLRLDEDLFLLDHTLGGRISEDPSLRALSVFPLTMSLEAMAEAAAAVVPGTSPIGLSKVRVHRWLAFERPQVTMEIVASPRPSGDAVEVRLSEKPDGEAPALLTVQGTVLLGARRPDPPPSSGPFEPRAPRPCPWAPEQLYAEGTHHGMFHGPSFRGVRSIDRIGEDGLVATLCALPAGGLFRSLPDPAFVLDPLLLDAASQTVGYWTAALLDRAFVVFPVGFERLDLYGPSSRPDAPARCRTRIRQSGADRILADIEVLSEDGGLLARLSGWEVKRIDLPERLYAFRLDPRGVVMSAPLPAPASSQGRALACRLELPDHFLDSDGEIWRLGLASTVLSRTERDVWRGMRDKSSRAEWLLGRLAAKDSVRMFLMARGGPRVYPADIEISDGADGRLTAGGPWVDRMGRAPAVSVQCANGVAAAVAGDAAESGRRDGDGTVATTL